MAEKIVVTSVGIISALGIGTKANAAALCNSESGLKYPVHLQTIHKDEFLLGEADYSNEQMAAMLGIHLPDTAYTRTTLLALVAVKDLLQNMDMSLLRNESLALISANTVGGMSSGEDMYMDFTTPPAPADKAKYIDTLDCGDSTQIIAEHYRINPLAATISTACSSSANAILLGARMIKLGIVKRAICGGCDALSRFTLNGFSTLKNVSKTPNKPFDQDRNGLNLGEAAGYLLLETESSAKERGAEIIAVLSGYNNSNEAYHPTAPSPNGDGAYLTMQSAIQMAGLQPQDISYINAHGTATLNNDVSEGNAIQRLFAGHTPPFSSTKPYTGHTLGAAGAVEAIFSIIALQENLIFPNLNFQTPMQELDIIPATAPENKPLHHVLSNSFGFGGNNVALVFSRP